MNMPAEKIRVIAMGGCGGMGQFAVRTAVSFDFVDEIVIADRDERRAREFAVRCGPKTTPVSVNVQDETALSQLIEGADVVMATVGPYYRFGVPVLRAAIRAGCHYLDINDDWEPTLEMLELDQEAKKAGITAVIGMGASPGLSNLLAVKAMGELDKVDDLITGWGTGGHEEELSEAPGAGASLSAATEHWIHQLTGKIRVRRDGEYTDANPFEEVRIDYPGIGPVTTHTVGHPEPITLPLFKPEIRNSWNVMNMPPYVIEPMRWVAGEVDAGRMSIDEATDQVNDVLAAGTGWVKLLMSRLGRKMFVQYLLASRKTMPYVATLFAYATGTRDGKPRKVGTRLSATPFGGMKRETMGGVTGVPLATALALFAKGKIEQRGVFAPEGAIDPDAFFDELAPLCTPTRKDANELVEISTSW
jgi:saccharopine dehydrogenase-like NADP-dependent oxidoreductase